ncbi:hypothetical protein OH76DRAFT_772140 [Lentinus brumalis]|uniref:F-box domain-containing protein n=1 Tax=Lentinus brumalis TaxID=2498619 RepID=A0A371D4S9_9APHY|nr:hypothetical protein OH76DRAFT_772140 [Polyporus brumalis]
MSMAVQRVVQCADVLVHIFEQMSPIIWNDGDTEDYFDAREERAWERKSLARAARVSHAFSESALDVLWSVLDQIDDLLLVLPVIVVPGANEHESEKTILVQDITLEQWSRFRAYAKRVRALKDTYRARHVDPSVWLLLEHQCEGTPLLPNLRRVQLDIRLSSPGEAFYFLTASVTDLQMNIESADFNATPTPDVAGVLYRLILVKLPHLRTLKVTSGLNELRPHYLEPITTLQSLHRLDMLDSGAMFDHAMLESVSSIASLRILWMDISYGSASGPFQGSLKGAFCDLITLHVRGSARDLDRFFSLADLGKLSTLHMNFTDPSGVPEICHAIHRASSALSCNGYRYLASTYLPYLDLPTYCPRLAHVSLCQTNASNGLVIPSLALARPVARPRTRISCLLLDFSLLSTTWPLQFGLAPKTASSSPSSGPRSSSITRHPWQ